MAHTSTITEDGSNGSEFRPMSGSGFLLLKESTPKALRSSGDKTATLNSSLSSSGSSIETADAPEQQPIAVDTSSTQENTIIDASDPPPQSLHMPLAPVKKEDKIKSESKTEPTTPTTIFDHHDDNHPAPESLHKPLEPVKSVRATDSLMELTSSAPNVAGVRSRASTVGSSPVTPYTPTNLEVTLSTSPPTPSSLKNQFHCRAPNQIDVNRIENGTESTESTSGLNNSGNSTTPRGLVRSRPRVIPCAPPEPTIPVSNGEVSKPSYSGMNSASLNKVDTLLLHSRMNNHHPLMNAQQNSYSSSFTDFSSLLPNSQNRAHLSVTKGSSTPQVRQVPYDGINSIPCSPAPESVMNGAVNSENIKSLIEWKRNHPNRQALNQINAVSTPDLHSDRVTQSTPISAAPSPMLFPDRRVISQSANNSPHESVHPINDELMRRRGGSAIIASPSVQVHPSPPIVKLSAWAQQQQLEVWQREWKLTKSRAVGTDGVGVVSGANVSNTRRRGHRIRMNNCRGSTPMWSFFNKWILEKV